MPKNKPAKMGRKKGGGDCLFRFSVALREGARDEDTSIPLVLATETPIDTFDFSRMDVVKEIVRIDGMTLPKQVPLLDSHNRDSVRNVLGSIRDLERNDGRILGRAYFAQDPVSQQTFQNYRDGHLTDVSVGARRDEVEWEGDIKITTRSTLVEGSAVVAGADPNAKMLPALRACIDPYSMKDEEMEKLRKLLIERGMPENIEGDKIFNWVIDNISRVDETEEKKSIIDKEVVDLIREAKVEISAQAEIKKASEEKAAAEKEAAEKEAEIERAKQKNPKDDLKHLADKAVERIKEVFVLCRTHNIDEKQTDEWVNSDLAIDAISHEILNRMQSKGIGKTLGPSGRIDSGTSERDKFYEAARSGLITRSIQTTGCDPRGYIAGAEAWEESHRRTWHDQQALMRAKELRDELDKPAPGAEDFRYKRLPDLAREFCELSGMRTSGLPDQEVCRRAIGMNDFVQRASDGPAFNTTGSFPNLLLDAMNKTLRGSYDEAPQTYTQWVRQAPSVADFKTIHRVIAGEIEDMEAIGENSVYKEKSFTDSRENYVVVKHGGIFSISFEAIVNDDLGAIQRIPQIQGNSMRRTINKSVYDILINNNVLTADSIALFHATSHGANLDTTALAEGAMDTGFNVMMTQSGLSSATTLGIVPRFLIVPANLSATALRLVGGNYIPAIVANVPLYAAGGPRPMEVVMEGHLDSDSTTAWYFAADNSVVDTVEITFLQGEEAPVLTREDGFTTDTIKYKMRQTFSPKAIDFRGLYQGNT